MVRGPTGPSGTLVAHTTTWDSLFRSWAVPCVQPTGPFGTSLSSFSKRNENLFSPSVKRSEQEASMICPFLKCILISEGVSFVLTCTLVDLQKQSSVLDTQLSRIFTVLITIKCKS